MYDSAYARKADEATSAEIRSNSGYSSRPVDTSIGSPFINITFTPAVMWQLLTCRLSMQATGILQAALVSPLYPERG